MASQSRCICAAELAYRSPNEGIEASVNSITEGPSMDFFCDLNLVNRFQGWHVPGCHGVTNCEDQAARDCQVYQHERMKVEVRFGSKVGAPRYVSGKYIPACHLSEAYLPFSRA